MRAQFGALAEMPGRQAILEHAAPAPHRPRAPRRSPTSTRSSATIIADLRDILADAPALSTTSWPTSSKRSASEYADPRRTEIVSDDGRRSLRRGPDRAKRTWSSPSPTPATSSARASRPTAPRGAAGGAASGMQHARRGLRRPALRRVDPLLHPLLHRPRARSTGSRSTTSRRRPARRGASAIVNLVQLSQSEKIAAIDPRAASSTPDATCCWPPRQGMVKKTELTALRQPPRRRASSPWGVEDDDPLIGGRPHRRATTRSSSAPSAGHGDPLRRGGRPPHGARAPTA